MDGEFLIGLAVYRSVPLSNLCEEIAHENYRHICVKRLRLDTGCHEQCVNGIHHPDHLIIGIS